MVSIRRRTRANGTQTWQVLWRESGRQQGHTVDNENDAKLWARLIEQTGTWDGAEKAHRRAAAKGYTLTNAVEDHIRLLLKPGKRTIDSYKSMLRDHIRDTIGQIPVTELTPLDLAEWVRGMQAKGLSPKTIRNVHGLISASLARCVPERIPVNPCERIELPGDEHADDLIRFLTYDEFMRIHQALPEHYRPFALFLVVTGARFSEATAVQVRDIDLNHRPATVRINKAWKRNGSSGWIVGPPKTNTSKRTVSLSDPLAEVLGPLTDRGRNPEALLFVNEDGGRINQANFYRVWQAAVKRSGITSTPRVHDLRHTSASWLIQAGYDLFKVARRLGHANTNMVDTKYGHLMLEGMVEGARRIEDAMRPKELEQPTEEL